MSLPSTLRPKNAINSKEKLSQNNAPTPSTLRPKKQEENLQNNVKPNEPEEESFWKSAFRTISQPLQGIAATSTPGLLAGLWQILASGEVFDPEEIEHIKMISEREGIPFDEEKYMQAAHEALGAIPTVNNLARLAERKTGIPLEPKNRLQKGLRFATEAGRLAPEGASFRGMNVGLPKPVLGAGLEGANELLQEAGLPQPIAEAASYALLKQPKAGSPSLSIGTEKKPSGLTTRRYEKINTPQKISENKIRGINETVEREFRDIASDIIENSPIEQTYSALKNDKSFKKTAGEAFQKVEELAENIPDILPTKTIKSTLAKKIGEKSEKGFTPSEYELSRRKFLKKFIKSTPEKDISTKDLVSQYRQNNKEFGQIKEIGKSSAYNRGKRDALLDYNRSIAETIEKRYPGTEFSNLFKSSNERWAKIMDAESIDKFMDKLFDGKINFKTGNKLLEKEGMQEPFKRALGEKGFKDFKQLTEDLMSTEQASKLMKVAQKKGFDDFAKTGLTYLISPKASYFKAGWEGGKGLYKKAWESLLDKPQLAIKWDKGIKEFKKGNFSEAEKIFNSLEKDFKN